MILPAPQTPLYNHSLPAIETWLKRLGGNQDSQQPHCWSFHYPTWEAQLSLEIEELVVSYQAPNQAAVTRSFKYSLSREDIESAVLAGP